MRRALDPMSTLRKGLWVMPGMCIELGPKPRTDVVRTEPWKSHSSVPLLPSFYSVLKDGLPSFPFACLYMPECNEEEILVLFSVSSVCTRGGFVLQRGTAVLLEHLAGNLASAITVSTQLDIAPQHHLFMMGRNGSNIKHIMQRTGAQVHFPDPNCPQKKSTVYVQGNIDSVCLARQYLMVRALHFFKWCKASRTIISKQ